MWKNVCSPLQRHPNVTCCAIVQGLVLVFLVVIMYISPVAIRKSYLASTSQAARKPRENALEFQEDPLTADLIFVPDAGEALTMHDNVQLIGQNGNASIVANLSSLDIVEELRSKRVAAVVMRQVLSPELCQHVIDKLESQSLATRFLSDAPRDNVDNKPAFQMNLWGGHGSEHAGFINNMSVEHKALIDEVLPSVVQPVLSVHGFRRASEYVYPKSRAFVRRFRQGERTEHEPHHDSADLSACYQLSSSHDYAGGFYFYPYPHDEMTGERIYLPPSEQGDLILWNGGEVLHGSQVTLQPGKTRYMMATFWYGPDSDRRLKKNQGKSLEGRQSDNEVPNFVDSIAYVFDENGAEIGVEEPDENGEHDRLEDEEFSAESDLSDIHYVAQSTLSGLEAMHEHQSGTKDAIMQLISDEYEESLPGDEIMIPVRLVGHTDHLTWALDAMTPDVFLAAIMQGRNHNDPDLMLVPLSQLREEDLHVADDVIDDISVGDMDEDGEHINNVVQ